MGIAELAMQLQLSAKSDLSLESDWRDMNIAKNMKWKSQQNWITQLARFNPSPSEYMVSMYVTLVLLSENKCV